MSFLRKKPLPHVFEAMPGYLLRLAQANHTSPQVLAGKLFGHHRWPGPKELMKLAEVIHCTEQEISELAVVHDHPGASGRGWSMAGQRLSKSYFVSPRRHAVCPHCLIERPFLHGLWLVSLQSCCFVHHCRLLQQCSACGQALQSQRLDICHCQCGADLRQMRSDMPDQRELCVSQLLATMVGQQFCIVADVPEWLQVVGADDLCKLLWFLGWILPGILCGVVRSGRHAPDMYEAKLIANTAFASLADWPNAFLRDLERIGSPRHQSSASYLDRAFTSVHRYITRELDHASLAPVRQAYQTGVEALWKKWDRTHALRLFGAQLTLDFEDYADSSSETGVRV